MNPPPPILPQHGFVTACAYPTATAASTALPPRRNISSPASDASRCAETTIPCAASTAGADAAIAEADHASPSSTPSTRRMI